MRFKQQIVILLFALLAATGAAAATLTGKVDRTSISANETLELTLYYDGQSSSDTIDFSPLEKQFELISGPSYRSSYESRNGRIESYISWTVVLYPKSTGKLTIPSLELNGATSSPIDITVTESTEPTEASADNPVFLETEIDKESVYVQEQIILTSRLYTAVNLQNFNSSRGDIPNAEIIEADEKRYYKQINGIDFLVLESRLILFPTASGTLEIPPRRITGYVPPSRRYPRGRRFIKKGKGKKIEVKPQPANSGDNWLPAVNVMLSEQPTEKTGEWHAGEPITRKITITGLGVTAEQLPEISLPENDQYRVYPDQPQLDQMIGDKGVSSTRAESIAIVPTKPGILNLPAIRLQWWDTTENRLKTVELAGRTYNVLPAENNTYTSPPPTPVTTVTESDNNLWLKLSLLGNILFFLLITVLLWRRRTGATPPTTNTKSANRSETEKRLFSAVRTAGKNNDQKALRETLLQWAQHYWSEQTVSTLDQLGELVGDNELRSKLNDLDQSLYGRKETPVDTADIATTLKRYRANGLLVTGGEKDRGLKPLYPT